MSTKKLIEVALPLDAINAASALEKQPFTRRHPRSLHIWWARRPLAAARAVIFAQMVDDPSAHPDLFPTEKAQQKERARLFKIIEELVKWENTTNEKVLQAARDEIRQSWRRACAENADHPRADELFNRDVLPAFHDPFAGGGALPLEAQRLGLEAYASDLNPVAVLINNAMIEIPPKFAGRPPVNPAWQAKSNTEKLGTKWKGAQGLAEDVRYYGQWMRDEAEKRIGHLYPKVKITPEIVAERPDLKKYEGRELTVIAWLWARTVKSPNPAFADVDVPLVSNFMLSTKKGKEAYVEPIIENGSYRFTVKNGKPEDVKAAKAGTKLGRGSNFECVMSGMPIPGSYIKSEGMAGRMGACLMGIVLEGDRERVYVSPLSEHERAARAAQPTWRPEGDVPARLTGGTCVPYGLTTWCDRFTPRQLVALTTFSDLVQEARQKIRKDALAAGMDDPGSSPDQPGTGLEAGGTGATAYAEALGASLTMATTRWSDLSNTICTWNTTNENVRALFSRQAIPMTWDFVELSPFSPKGSWYAILESGTKSFPSLPAHPNGKAEQSDAASQSLSLGRVVSSDPPYYDNIGYADLSDFFYVWLRRSLRDVFTRLFTTVAVPKSHELVATPYRHGGRDEAEAFFLDGMTEAMQRLAEQAHPAFPVTIYYAFKQSESKGRDGTASTGWETFLDAVVHAGFGITGTWPIRTERGERSISIGANALASSIVLVCRKRPENTPSVTRREFVNALKVELPAALAHLQRGNIAPVDLAQAAIGPGMAVFTRYEKVLDAAGKPLTVRDALTLINQILDESLAEQEGDFDADTRWALAWFEQFGFKEGEYGIAETLSKAKNTSVAGMKEAGILDPKAPGGKVRLLAPGELPEGWDPEKDPRLTNWDIVHHLIRVLAEGGESAAAELYAKLGTRAEVGRELAYRLYNLCERKKRAQEALAYNGLVQSWPEIVRLAAGISTEIMEQGALFE